MQRTYAFRADGWRHAMVMRIQDPYKALRQTTCAACTRSSFLRMAAIAPLTCCPCTSTLHHTRSVRTTLLAEHNAFDRIEWAYYKTKRSSRDFDNMSLSNIRRGSLTFFIVYHALHDHIFVVQCPLRRFTMIYPLENEIGIPLILARVRIVLGPD